MPSSSTHSSAHVVVDGVSKSFASRRILTDITVTLPAGERIGLIGENGSGKSTLLRIIAGLEPADVGTVRAYLPGGSTPRIGLLHQEPPFAPSATIAAALDSALEPQRMALEALDTAAASLETDPAAADLYSAALDTAERLDVWSVEARVEQMLTGLGLAHVDRMTPVSSLSGGQRSRLALVWFLLNIPDVLLLDEPTNHLDDAATQFLRRTLEAWSGPVLIASHDRSFLDEAVTSLIDLDPSPQAHVSTVGLITDGSGTGIGITRHTGSYSDYLLVRAEERKRWENRYREEQDALHKLRAAVRDNHTIGHPGREARTEGGAAKKFYADRNAKVVSRRVNDARARLEEAEGTQVRKPTAQLSFAGLTVANGERRLRRDEDAGLLLTTCGLGVDGRLAPTDLSISTGQRWLITGANGTGNTTCNL